MADAETLTLAFIGAHPADAARVLEDLPAAAAAALFARVPARLGAPVLAAMLPPAAARSLAALDDDRAVALLAALGAQPLVAVLRHVPEPRRGRLLADLPTAAALAARLLLGLPEDSVGAWTDPDVVAVPPEASAGEALERVRRLAANVARVYVVDPAGRLAGYAELAALVRAPADLALAALMTKPAAALAVIAPLAGAARHPGWDHAEALPVVERDGRLIGVLTRAVLARALARIVAGPAAAPVDTVAGTLARGYWHALSGVVEAAATLLPPVPPLKGEADER